MIFLRRLTAILLFIGCLAGATREPVRARRAMVVSARVEATRAGLEVLRNGGNAVDAAVAVGFALAVVHPRAGNLGGGGFMLIRFAGGRTSFLDFRERAPAAAHRDMYLGPDGEPTDAVIVGYRASGVPGTSRGLEMAYRKYGSRPWKELLAPAVQLARDGFPVTHEMSRDLRSTRLARFPESKRIFQRDGRFYEPGEIFRQPDLHRTLRRIAKHGAGDFYEGQTARLIARDMKRHGGTITLDDLKQYKPVERRTLLGQYRGYEIIAPPPPSSGGVGILQMLNMLENSGYERSGPGSASAIHHVAEAMRRYFADRAAYFGDPDFVAVPVERLISKSYARRRWKSLRIGRASDSLETSGGLPPPETESSETTHYSIVDEQGNAVAVTYTLNGSYGSGVTARGTGVLLNNEMDDFSIKPGAPNEAGLLTSEHNAIEPGKRPLSSMTPTIVARDGKLFLVVGSPGGPTIISTVLEVITNVIDFKMNLQQAVDFPRFHHQWMPDVLRLERHGISSDTIERLRQRGHNLRFVEKQGRVMAIQVVEDGLLGAADARSEGVAMGY